MQVSPEAVNTFGLIANMVGVALAFVYGFPQPSHEEGVAIGLEPATPLPGGKTVAQHDGEVRKQKKRYLFWSRLGLALMFVGFLLQLSASWMPH